MNTFSYEFNRAPMSEKLLLIKKALDRGAEVSFSMWHAHGYAIPVMNWAGQLTVDGETINVEGGNACSLISALLKRHGCVVKGGWK